MTDKIICKMVKNINCLNTVQECLALKQFLNRNTKGITDLSKLKLRIAEQCLIILTETR